MANDHKRNFHTDQWLLLIYSFVVLVLSLIYEQLITSQNSLLIGNASLAFGHIVIHPSTRLFLQKSIGITRVLRQLLKLVEESWLSKPAKKNVAIFLTKLVKIDDKYESLFSHPRSFLSSFSFLQEFRKQHGTEILHSALKDVDLWSQSSIFIQR